MLTNTQTREVLHRVCERNGVGKWFSDNVYVEWTDSFAGEMGQAIYGSGADKHRIRLSTTRFLKASESEMKSAVAHQMCHIVAWRKFGSDIKPHGVEWRACMLLAGFDPSN